MAMLSETIGHLAKTINVHWYDHVLRRVSDFDAEDQMKRMLKMT